MTSVVTDDNSFIHKLKVHQPSSGYRFSLEPFLLSSFLNIINEKRIVDLGSGVGIIGLILSLRYKDVKVVGVEIQKELHDLAIKNIKENGLSERMEDILGDFRTPAEYFDRTSFDIAVSNPPYRPLGAGRLNKEEKRSVARHEIMGGALDVIDAAHFVLRSKGKLFMIYSAERSSDLIFMLKDNGFEPKRMRFVHTKRDRNADMVIVEAVLGGGAGMKVISPLIIYGEDNKYTDEVGKIIANNSQLPIDMKAAK